MILGFSKTFPWDEPTRFVERIKSGKKIHTIREDKHERWREGMKIHFATGTRTPDYNQFEEGVCTGVQHIVIKDCGDFNPIVLVDGRPLSNDALYLLATNDGFNNIQHFRKWFDSDFEGRLIHWTDYRY